MFLASGEAAERWRHGDIAEDLPGAGAAKTWGIAHVLAAHSAAEMEDDDGKDYEGFPLLLGNKVEKVHDGGGARLGRFFDRWMLRIGVDL